MTKDIWQPPTPEKLSEVFNFHWNLIHSWQSDENNFPFLYNRQVAEEGERYEVLPGLFGKVDNYYVTNPGSMWHGSRVWINNGEFKAWHVQQGRREA